MACIVTDHLEETSRKFPEKTAFSDDRREISFEQLHEEVKRLGTFIINEGFFKQPVCIFMDKGIECIDAMAGVCLSGNFYTVIDTAMPGGRISKILNVLRPLMFITDMEHGEKLDEVIAAYITETDIDAKDIKKVIFEDAVKTSADDVKIEAVRNKIDEKDTMYVLFTSGSTGVPKGVVISHRAVEKYLDYSAKELPVDEDTIFANQAPFYFIMSGFEIFLTMYTGATCHIVPKMLFSFPVMLLNYLNEKKVNTLYWVPSVLSFVANTDSLPEVHINELKTVMFGGEAMPAKQLNQWIKEYPDVIFINLYGPTELTDITTAYVIDRDIKDDELLPMGKAASHMRVLLIDDEGKEVAPGEMGEVCGTGPSLADGYYKMPEKTAEVFVKNPLYKEGDDPDMRMMYKTGDLARMDENGDLIFMGRKDFQIKHMGHRIELGEIEAAVSALSGVEYDCCLYDDENQQIILFFTGTKTADDINEELSSFLPAYMLPTRYEFLEEMPFNLNGKIDRAGLKARIKDQG